MGLRRHGRQGKPHPHRYRAGCGQGKNRSVARGGRVAEGRLFRPVNKGDALAGDEIRD